MDEAFRLVEIVGPIACHGEVNEDVGRSHLQCHVGISVDHDGHGAGNECDVVVAHGVVSCEKKIEEAGAEIFLFVFFEHVLQLFLPDVVVSAHVDSHEKVFFPALHAVEG